MRLLPLALLLSGLASAGSLGFTIYPPAAPEAGRTLTLTVLLENKGKSAATFNTATCPITKVTSDWTRKVVQEIKLCAHPLRNVTIPAGGKYVWAFDMPKTLPTGPYQATVRLNDSVNGHKADLKTAFTVWDAPQVIQQVVMPPVVLAGQPLTVQVATTNLSGKVFSQDLRLCPTQFVIFATQRRVVYQTPSGQACTGDLRPTTLQPDQRHLESWRIGISLKPGKYTIQHISFYGTPTTSFEVK